MEIDNQYFKVLPQDVKKDQLLIANLLVSSVKTLEVLYEMEDMEAEDVGLIGGMIFNLEVACTLFSYISNVQSIYDKDFIQPFSVFDSIDGVHAYISNVESVSNSRILYGNCGNYLIKGLSLVSLNLQTAYSLIRGISYEDFKKTSNTTTTTPTTTTTTTTTTPS